MGFRAVCIEGRCKCSYKSGNLVVTKDDGTTMVHLSEITSVTFCTTQVYVSAYLMSELAKQRIPVIFSDENSLPVAQSLPLFGAHNCSKRLAEQLEWTLPAKKRVWQQVVKDKIAAQASLLLAEGHDEEAGILEDYRCEVRSGDPTNREAAAALTYFHALFGPDFTREQSTYINASLNYGYAILQSKVSREIISRGYLTQLGIFHHGEQNQWNLTSDLMEPFRPMVDGIVIRSGLRDFNAEMKHLLIAMMDNEVVFRDGTYKAGSVISRYVLDCLDALNKRGFIEDIETYSLL